MALVIVKEDATEDYETLDDAISASEDEIEIQGTWTAAETSNYSISVDTTITATGSSKAPIDATRTTSTHWRSRVTSGHVFTCTADLTIVGLDIINQSTGTSDELIRLNSANLSLSATQCVLAFNARTTQQDVVYANSAAGCTVNLIQCAGWNIQRAIVDVYTTDITVNINSCHFYNCCESLSGFRPGIISGVSGTTITASIINSAFHFDSSFTYDPINGSAGDCDGTQTVVDSFKNTSGNTDSDWSDTTDTITLTNTQAGMNWTDDNTKSSDGDWVIVEDITGSSPFSLELQDNTYNEAQDYSSTTSGGGLTKPTSDWDGTSCPQNTNYDVGPFEIVAGGGPTIVLSGVYYRTLLQGND